MERFLFETTKDKNTRNGEESSNDRLHGSDLFDQDEDSAGEKYDLATGKPIDNSTVTELDGLTITDENDNNKDNDLEELKDAISNDKEASEWLKKHLDELS